MFHPALGFVAAVALVVTTTAAVQPPVLDLNFTDLDDAVQDLAKMVGARGAAKLRKRLAKILASIKLTEGDSGGKRVVRGSGGAEADGGSGGWPSTGSAAKRQKLA